MPSIQSLVREGRATIILALPLIIGQVSQMLIGVADTLMIGRLGKVPLAAATFANNVVHLPFMFGIGMSIAVSVRVSQARGAERPADARGAVRNGLWLTLAIGVLTVLVAWVVLPLLPYFGQKPEVIAATPAYFLLIAFSLVPGMAVMALKSFCDAMNRPWPAFWIMLGGVVLNVFFNWILIYGRLGAPELGLEGAGVATLLARLATLVGMLLLCRRLPAFRDWIPRRWVRAPHWPTIRGLVKIGLPTSLQILAEMSAFVMSAIIIGWLGVAALASHQVAITCAATAFMVPLGLSQALTVRIGEAWGARQFGRWRPIVVSASALALGFALSGAAIFLLFNRALAAVFLPNDPATAEIAASLLVVAAAFQLGDALQIVSAGGLRGLNDVRVPAWLAFLAYWVISIPLGYLLAFPLHWGVHGVWWAITLGLSLTAVTLTIRLWVKTGREPPLEDSQIGEPAPEADDARAE